MWRDPFAGLARDGSDAVEVLVVVPNDVSDGFGGGGFGGGGDDQVCNRDAAAAAMIRSAIVTLR